MVFNLPSERNGDNSGAVLGDLYEGGLGHVEVLTRRVAPATVVVRKRRVWRAEVGGGDGDAAREARFGGVVAP